MATCSNFLVDMPQYAPACNPPCVVTDIKIGPKESLTQQQAEFGCCAGKGNTFIILSAANGNILCNSRHLCIHFVQLAFTLTSLRSFLLSTSVLVASHLHKPPVTRPRVLEYNMAVASALVKPPLSCQRRNELGGSS